MNIDISQTILIVSCLMVIFTALGAGVQRVSRFIRPTDFVTLAIMFVSLIGMSSVDGLSSAVWFLPAMAGYVTGYAIAGKAEPLMVCYLDPDNLVNDIDYYVTYQMDGRTYIADQNNRAFLNRIMGIHHELLSDVPITDASTWPISIHVPRKRRVFNGKVLYINDRTETSETKKIWWKWTAEEVTTEVALADASGMDNMDFMRSAKVLKKQRKDIVRLRSKLYKANSEVPQKTAESIFEMAFSNHNILSQQDLEELVDTADSNTGGSKNE